ncbi:hypothetical protein VMF7928_01061 [Vibrio marisflavi CECT 7928]|uniref:Uncharacterized protein n=1 Tax=Vibrio marisflavi CECT 7928 TaxID=634439 RepID=A0ABM9A189_9VIBR|nr:hypothetical protein VMF7928_01061 [Vibrio marisflavi CECT 7928]
MFSSLAALGIQEPENIERYTLRKVAHEDLLKIYFRKQKGELFTKCLRFKYPRQHKQISVDSGRRHYREVSEINHNLTLVIEELVAVATSNR